MFLGSAPPFRFCVQGDKPLYAKDMDYYYGGSSNLFWDILFRVFEPGSLSFLKETREQSAELPERTERQISYLQGFLTKHKLGITDILYKFERMGTSAADYHLKVLEYKDVLRLLAEHESLSQIFCTSKNRVYFWLQDYLKSCSPKGLLKLHNDGSRFELINSSNSKTSRTISIYILPSPSARGVMRYANKEQFLLETSQLYYKIFRQARENP
jgi:G:T/U-mismatch repair DNA glycosylase